MIDIPVDVDQCVDYFAKVVDADLRLRNDEIGKFKEVVEGFSESASAAEHRHSRAIINGGFLTLYAHWEGSVKCLVSSYLLALRVGGAPVSALIPELSYAHWLGVGKSNSTNVTKAEAYRRDILYGRSLFFDQEFGPSDVNTKSNLWGRTLLDLLKDFGIIDDIEKNSLSCMYASDESLGNSQFRYSGAEADPLDPSDRLIPENALGHRLELPTSPGFRDEKSMCTIDWIVGLRNRLGHGDISVRKEDFPIDSVVFLSCVDAVRSWQDWLRSRLIRAIEEKEFLSIV